MLNKLRRGILIICWFFWGISYAEIFEECGKREGLYISSDLGCSYYIFCYGEDSFTEQCEEDNPYFSESDQTCDTDPSVCPNESGVSTGVEEQSSTMTALITLGTGSILNSTQMSTPAAFTSTSVTSTMGPTNSTSLSPNTASPAATHLSVQCPLSDDPKEIVFLADTKSCAKYYMCYHGEPVTMHCSNMLHFDQKSQKCDYPENVQCQLDYSSSSAHDKCQIHTSDVFSHPSNCNYYYLCRFGYLMVMQCPFNMDWDYEKRACVRRGKAKCYESFMKTYKKMK